ncbi:MAG: hypothetical protein HY744_03235 [Deltaproteobacteria bacterium]|nr:hypothetical protein [Deltaproteobacteria bacterium]
MSAGAAAPRASGEYAAADRSPRTSQAAAGERAPGGYAAERAWRAGPQPSASGYPAPAYAMAGSAQPIRGPVAAASYGSAYGYGYGYAYGGGYTTARWYGPQTPAPAGYYWPTPPPAPQSQPWPGAPAAGAGPDAPEGASGNDADEDAPPHLDLTVGTQAPLALGGQVTIELPARLLLQGDIGWMPPAYGSAIAGLATGIGGADASAGALVGQVLGDSLVVRVAGGWRPFARAGFEVMAGYTHLALSGSLGPADLASLVDDEQAAQALQQLQSPVTLRSKLHNLHVALGWRWVLARHLVVRASVGYTQTLTSSSSIEIPGEPAIQAAAEPRIDRELDAVYTDNVKLPVLALGAGYRF